MLFAMDAQGVADTLEQQAQELEKEILSRMKQLQSVRKKQIFTFPCLRYVQQPDTAVLGRFPRAGQHHQYLDEFS